MDLIAHIKDQLSKKINSYLRKKKQVFKTIVKKDLRKYSPVRTGKLLDIMLIYLNLNVRRARLNMNTKIPAGYPPYIRKPKHHGARAGWGMDYHPTNKIANVFKIGKTSGYGAYYRLFDPLAMPNYIDIMKTHSAPKIIQEVMNSLPDYKAKVFMPSGSGATFKVELMEMI